MPPPPNETDPANHNQSGNHVSPSGISLEHKLQGVAQIPLLQLPSSDVLDANHLQTLFIR
jgi:hypothetical protein